MRCIYLIHPYTPFSIFLHICYPWSQLRVSLSYCKAGRENCAAKHHLYPLVIWTSFVLRTVHPHIFSDASHKSMRLVMHSAAMPEALFYAHGTAHGVKEHVLFWIILIFYCICCASVHRRRVYIGTYENHPLWSILRCMCNENQDRRTMDMQIFLLANVETHVCHPFLIVACCEVHRRASSRDWPFPCVIRSWRMPLSSSMADAGEASVGRQKQTHSHPQPFLIFLHAESWEGERCGKDATHLSDRQNLTCS